MTDYFDAAVTVVLAHEGGYSDDANDPGGPTAFGISTRFLNQNNLRINPKYLTVDEAKFLYRKYFWLPNNLGLITQESIAIKLFDTIVNLGAHAAIELAQKLLDIAIDGILGPDTAGHLNALNASTFLNEYRQELIQYYESLVRNNPSLEEFLPDWLKRAAS